MEFVVDLSIDEAGGARRSNKSHISTTPSE